jgi:ABC-type branched-subunit amino acid transport system ATPase component
MENSFQSGVSVVSCQSGCGNCLSYVFRGFPMNVVESSPNVIVLAGPNGAGKSTAAPRLLKGTLGVVEFVNADVIAQGLAAFAPDRVAIEAGRIMHARMELCQNKLTVSPVLL